MLTEVMMSLFKGRSKIDKSELLFSRRDLLKIIIPVFFQQILAMTVGMINTMMVSNAGDAAVAGVSLVVTLDNVLIVFFTALVTGGSVIVAQRLGTSNTKDISEAAKQLMYATTIVATVVMATVLIFRVPLLNALFGDAEPEVLKHANDYFFLVCLSFPFLAISEAAGACFRSSGNSIIPLLTSLSINGILIGCNSIFIIWLDMGAQGAALSTLIARICGAAILLILVLNKKYPVHIENLFHYKPSLKVIKGILQIGVPNGIENTLFQFGRLLTQSLISTFATAVIAANSMALNLANFQYAVNTAFSVVMIPVVGRCIGAKRIDQAKHYSFKLMMAEYGMMWLVIAFTLIFIRPLMSAYGVSEDAVELTIKLVLYHSIMAAAIYPLGFLLPTTFRAASDVKFTLYVSMISMWVLRVALAYFLALESVTLFNAITLPGLGMGIMGVWVAMFLDWILRSTLYLIRYLRGRWLKSKLLEN
jgi:putative MATE family efflux protein